MSRRFLHRKRHSSLAIKATFVSFEYLSRWNRMRLSRWLPVPAAALALAAVMPPTPARADDVAPHVVAAERMSPAVVNGGATITVRAAVDDSGGDGSGVRLVKFTFDDHDADGALVGQVVFGAYDTDGPSLNGQNTRTGHTTLSPWVAGGTYTLDEISVIDYVGNSATYGRDGTGHSQSGDPVASLDFAMSSLDFDVVNPQSDNAAPVVAALRAVHNTVAAGEPLLVTSLSADDRSGVGSIDIQYTGPSGQHLDVSPDMALPAAGLGSTVIPSGADGGEWRATSVTLHDRAGNGVVFARDSATSYIPAGVRPFTEQPALDWSQLDVQITGGTSDHDAPVLSDVHRVDTGDIHPGDDIAFTYSISDSSALRDFSIGLQDSGGHVFSLDAACDIGRGQVVDALPLGFDPGPVQILWVLVGDELGNSRYIHPDGTTTTSAAPNDHVPWGPPLSDLDFTVVAGPASSTHAYPTRIACPRLPLLPVQLPTYVPAGTVVPLVGHVQQPDHQPVPAADVAVYAQTAGTAPRLLALTQTDTNGEYRATLPAVTVSTTVLVRYFGGHALQPLISPPHAVYPTRPQRVFAATETPVVRYPAVAVITGGVVPARRGANLELQVPTSGGWRTLGVWPTDALGRVRFIQPVVRGVGQYRLYARVSPGWAAAVSAPFTITVR